MGFLLVVTIPRLHGYVVALRPRMLTCGALSSRWRQRRACSLVTSRW